MASSNTARRTTMRIITSVLNILIDALMSISAILFFVTGADLYASIYRTMNEHTERSIHQSDLQFSDPLIPRKDVVSAPCLERSDSSPESSLHNKTRRREPTREPEPLPLEILSCILSWTEWATRAKLVFMVILFLWLAIGPILSPPSNKTRISTPRSGAELGTLFYVSSPLSPGLLDSTAS